MNVKQAVPVLVAALSISVLVACGGGGGSGGTSGGGGGSGGNGTAILTWNGPTTNSDSSTLADLAGYRVYQSTTSGSYTSAPVATVSAPSTGGGTATTTINNLAAGTYYFVVRAYDTSGNESTNALPGEVSKTIP